MKKIKISIKPIIKYTSNIKNDLYNSYLVNDEKSKEKYKTMKQQKIFDNFIGIISLFWIFKKQNILLQKIDPKLIRKNKNNKPIDVLNIFKEVIKLCANTNYSDDYFSQKSVWTNEAKRITDLIVPFYENDTFKTKEEIESFRKCIQALLNFNFIDLYTFDLNVLNCEDDSNKYDYLTKLIEEQINYLEASYEAFKLHNSPNFNFIFKMILTMRKSLI